MANYEKFLKHKKQTNEALLAKTLVPFEEQIKKLNANLADKTSDKNKAQSEFLVEERRNNDLQKELKNQKNENIRKEQELAEHRRKVLELAEQRRREQELAEQRRKVLELAEQKKKKIGYVGLVTGIVIVILVLVIL